MSDAMPIAWRVTTTAVAHAWLCDTMGHVNTRHVTALFDDAGMALLDALGHFGPAEHDAGLGWADVRLELDLTHEIRAGTVVRVRSAVTRLGRTSFTHRHQLVSGAELIHAALTVTTVRFDLRTRRAIPLPEHFAARVTAFSRGD